MAEEAANRASDQVSLLAEGVSPLNVSGLFDVVIGLAFIVLLIFALAFLFKKFGSAGVGMGGIIKVVAAMSLGGRDRIALISVGKKQMLLGISPGRIATLHVFEETIEEVIAQGESGNRSLGQRQSAGSEFSKKLQDLLSGNRA